jgi:hypothetical protein
MLSGSRQNPEQLLAWLGLVTQDSGRQRLGRWNRRFKEVLSEMYPALTNPNSLFIRCVLPSLRRKTERLARIVVELLGTRRAWR